MCENKITQSLFEFLLYCSQLFKIKEKQVSFTLIYFKTNIIIQTVQVDYFQLTCKV